MDSIAEEKIYHQIEKNLSNHIHEDSFTAGRAFHEEEHSAGRNVPRGGRITGDTIEFPIQEQKSPDSLPLSREDYIRQARESCLRQMNALQAQSRALADHSYQAELQISGRAGKIKAKSICNKKSGAKEDAIKEAASFRSLIIRSICVAVIFLSIFIIDKLKVEWKSFTYETIREYITENDSLGFLESKVVTWLK